MPGVTLSQIKKLKVLHVACNKCERKGRYRITGLIETYGPDKALPDLASDLCADCRNADTFTADRCNVFFPNLKPRS